MAQIACSFSYGPAPRSEVQKLSSTTVRFKLCEDDNDGMVFECTKAFAEFVITLLCASVAEPCCSKLSAQGLPAGLVRLRDVSGKSRFTSDGLMSLDAKRKGLVSRMRGLEVRTSIFKHIGELPIIIYIHRLTPLRDYNPPACSSSNRFMMQRTVSRSSTSQLHWPKQRG